MSNFVVEGLPGISLMEYDMDDPTWAITAYDSNGFVRDDGRITHTTWCPAVEATVRDMTIPPQPDKCRCMLVSEG